MIIRVVACVLTVVCCNSLCVVRCFLVSSVGLLPMSLFVARCVLTVVCCLLFVACCCLLAFVCCVRSLMYRSLLFVLRCSLVVVHRFCFC